MAPDGHGRHVRDGGLSRATLGLLDRRRPLRPRQRALRGLLLRPRQPHDGRDRGGHVHRHVRPELRRLASSLPHDGDLGLHELRTGRPHLGHPPLHVHPDAAARRRRDGRQGRLGALW